MGKLMTTALLAVLGLSTLGTSTRADDEKLDPTQVPAAVRKALKAKFPRAEIEGIEKEVEDGETVYEAEIEVGEEELTVSLSPEGKILEIEKEVEVEDLPAVVVAAVKKKYPKATIKEAEEVVEPDEDEVTYELVVQVGKRTRLLTIEVAAEIEEDEAQEDKD